MLSLLRQFCRSSWLLLVLGGWALFSFFVFSAKEGGSVWATIITVAWFPALCPPSTLWPAPSTLWSCAWLVLIIHHALYPFDQSMRYRLEQIMPTILPPCWPGSCTREVLAQCASVPLLKKVSVGTTGTLSHCSTFHTLQPSGKSIVYLSHGKSWPTSFPSSRHHQDPPTL